jgi:hypothetical protein
MLSQAAAENSYRQPFPGGRENRKHVRRPGKAVIDVTHERDNRRLSGPVHLVNVSVEGIALNISEPLAPGDRVKIELHNETRRFVKQVHGIVRWSRATPEGMFQIGIALNVWFTPRDMQFMTGSGYGGPHGQSVWVS